MNPIAYMYEQILALVEQWGHRYIIQWMKLLLYKPQIIKVQITLLNQQNILQFKLNVMYCCSIKASCYAFQKKPTQV